MACLYRALLILFFPLVVVGCGSSQGTSVDIEIKDPWVREPPAGANTAALYMKIVNKGNVPGYLIAVKTNVSEKSMIHRTHVTSDGLSLMEAVSKLEIPPSKELVLEPGGVHVMLTGLKKELKSGDDVEVTLTFEDLGDVFVKVPVRRFYQ